MVDQLLISWSIVVTELLSTLGNFLPRMLGATAIFVIGLMLAKLTKKILHQLLGAIKFSQLIGQTPMQAAFENQEIGRKIEAGIVTIVYWLAILLVIHASASILGISSVAFLVEKILNYLPQVFSAVLVLGFGVVLAGAVESLVKGTAKGLGIHQSIWLGKISSYLVMSITVLSALSELGIAKDFITILFIGFIGSLSLATGLALGLGLKDTVQKVFARWYNQNFEPESIDFPQVEQPSELKKKANSKK